MDHVSAEALYRLVGRLILRAAPVRCQKHAWEMFVLVRMEAAVRLASIALQVAAFALLVRACAVGPD